MDTIGGLLGSWELWAVVVEYTVLIYLSKHELLFRNFAAKVFAFIRGLFNLKTAILSAVSGLASAASSATLVSTAANDWQAFFGIMFGAVTLSVFIWATIKNQRRQDVKFKEWYKQHGDDKDP